MMNAKEQILRQTMDLWERAKVEFNLPPSAVLLDVRFDLKGKSAGQAQMRNPKTGVPTVRYNLEAIEKNFQHMVDETVPHEVAHIVCFLRPELGSGHDYGWRRVCRALGGKGVRCHSMDLKPGRNLRQFLYVASCGTEIKLTSVRHNKVQKGTEYSSRRTGGKITKNHFVRAL